jgi:hypothetical protein
VDGGEGGIRTREAVLPPTRFPVALLRPLGHLSAPLEGSGQKARRPSMAREADRDHGPFVAAGYAEWSSLEKLSYLDT